MCSMFDGNVSFDFDIDFNNAIKNGLTWYPWIGKDYSNSKHKVLIVAESHYASKKERTAAQQMIDIDNVADDKDYTREVVHESWIHRWWSTRTLDNINKALVGRNNFDGRLLWNKLAFYNFIQRPMATVSERPRWDEFANGWRNFIDVLYLFRTLSILFNCENRNCSEPHPM